MLAAVAAGEAAGAGRLREIAVAAGIAAAVLFTLGLALDWTPLVGCALLALGTEYAVALVGRSSADSWAVAYAAAYLLVGELGYAALEERRLDAGRLLAVAALGAAGGLVAGGLLVVGQASAGGGLAIEAAGVAAAVGAITLVSALARRGERDG